MGFIGNVFWVVAGHGLRTLAASERIDDPAGTAAIIDANNALTLDHNFHVQFSGAFEFNKERTFRARSEGDIAVDTFRLNGSKLGCAAASVENLLNEAVCSKGRRLRPADNREYQQEAGENYQFAGAVKHGSRDPRRAARFHRMQEVTAGQSGRDASGIRIG